MKKASIISILTLYPVLIALPAFEAFCPVRAAASDYTYLYPGARANALGAAFSSLADDPYTMFYNPAGLSNLRNTEARFGLGRRLSPLAPAGEASFVYVRPAPNTVNRTFGVGYHAVRQTTLGRRDSILFGMGDSFILKYLQRPVIYGGNLRIVNLSEAQKSHLGIGFDAGILFASNWGLKTGVALTDVNLGLGRSLATLTLGNSYRYGDSAFGMDLKVRGSYAEVFYGLEHAIFNGLLQFRAGKGASLNGPGYLALGLGVNAFPWILDFAASIPWKGFNQNAGVYEMNVGYRFDVPTYTERFVGDAAAKAGALKTQIEDLRAQKAGLETSIAAYRVNKGVLESELTLLQSRMREMEERRKNLELELIEAGYKKDQPRPKKPVFQPKPEKWPKFHKVAPGDTLRSIAAKYYGNPNLWERIYDNNQKHILKGLPVEGATLEIPVPPPER
ncbi:MAG: hypothetical protein HY796_00555 [Elusimicrobia bacterium]|nr:hypothetical protein [Elusimicrobiota bacterium]